MQTVEKEESLRKIEESQYGIWDEEYESLVGKDFLEKLSKFIYEDNGTVRVYGGGGRNISGKTLSQIDAYWLVKNIEPWIYEITEKGRYFLKRFSSELEIPF